MGLTSHQRCWLSFCCGLWQLRCRLAPDWKCATASSLYGGADNDLVSISGDVSAGQILAAQVLIQSSSPDHCWVVPLSDLITLVVQKKLRTALPSATSAVVLFTANLELTLSILRCCQSRLPSTVAARVTPVTIGGSLSSGLLEGGDGADSFILADVTSSTVKGGEGDDLVSASGLISAGALYGNSGNDSFEVGGAVTSTSVLVVKVMTLMTIGGVATTLNYEGGIGADTIKSVVLLLAQRFLVRQCFCDRRWS